MGFAWALTTRKELDSFNLSKQDDDCDQRKCSIYIAVTASKEKERDMIFFVWSHVVIRWIIVDEWMDGLEQVLFSENYQVPTRLMVDYVLF